MFRIVLLLRLAHVFNMSLSQLLLDDIDFFVLKPVNLERLSERKIREALNILAENIKEEMEISNISLHDLEVRILDIRQLESILNSEIFVTYYKLAYICDMLWDDEEDPVSLLRRLLKGVSTLGL